MREVISQTAKLFVYLWTIRMRTRVGLRWPPLLPRSARCSNLGCGRNCRGECGNGLQEMRLRAIKRRIFGVTKESTDRIGLTLVNDIEDR